MSTEPGWAYDVLGVKPGVSDRELKAAHRDLAKVWHPDRFLHDPRLQEKAQEKLKEINEAYEQLISRHQRRVPPPPRPSQRSSNGAHTKPAAEVVVQRRSGVGWHWYVALALVVFGVVFALTTQKLVRQPGQAIETTQVEEEAVEQPANVRQEPTHTVRNRTENDSASSTEAVSETAPAAVTESTPAVPTVTVVIDPASGLLATPSCPVKTRMTYPSGSEPRGHCNVTHIVKPEKESGIKGLAKRIL